MLMGNENIFNTLDTWLKVGYAALRIGTCKRSKEIVEIYPPTFSTAHTGFARMSHNTLP